jgi:hypothetical protein
MWIVKEGRVCDGWNDIEDNLTNMALNGDF